MLKLPKDVVADPRHDALAAKLEASARPLWEQGRVLVPEAAFNEALGAALAEALAEGEACQGLEGAESALAIEQKGLDALRRKAPAAAPSPRASRVLFLANDGSTRFYRDAEALLLRHADRLLGCRLAIDGDALGKALLGEARLVRAVLVTDKRAAARALLALAV